MKLLNAFCFERTFKQGSVNIKSLTWAKDSYGLFDYESQQMLEKQYRTRQDNIIVRNNTDVYAFSPEDDVLRKSGTGLLTLHVEDDEYYIWGKHWHGKALSRYRFDAYWLVVKHLPNSGYQLSQGDIFRVGRVTFKVREVSGRDLDSTQKFLRSSTIIKGGANGGKRVRLPKPQNVNAAEGQLNTKGELIANKICRICFCDNFDDDNPMISPCNCTGTMEFIHLNCLQLWLASKLSKKERPSCTSYIWRTLNWELCKVLLPSSIEVNGKTQELIELPKDKSGCIILETLPEQRTGQKSIHVIPLGQNGKVYLGRGQDNDIRVADISVSRSHAYVRIKNGSAYIHDNKSKFGTLVKASRPILLENDSEVAIQSGRTLLFFSIVKPSTWSCCFDMIHGGDEDEINADITGLDRQILDSEFNNTNVIAAGEMESSSSEERHSSIFEEESDHDEEDYAEEGDVNPDFSDSV